MNPKIYPLDDAEAYKISSEKRKREGWWGQWGKRKGGGKLQRTVNNGNKRQTSTKIVQQNVHRRELGILQNYRQIREAWNKFLILQGKSADWWMLEKLAPVRNIKYCFQKNWIWIELTELFYEKLISWSPNLIFEPFYVHRHMHWHKTQVAAISRVNK